MAAALAEAYLAGHPERREATTTDRPPGSG